MAISGDACRGKTVATARTLQEVRDRLGEFGYESGSLPDLRKALDRAARLHDHLPLDRIPASIDAFDARWGSRVDALALGFRSPGAFRKWRSLVRGALKRATGLVALREAAVAAGDDWQQIIDHVTAAAGLGRRYGPNRQITLLILAERARLAGRMPRGLDAEWAQAQHDALRYERRKAFRRALAFLGELVAERDPAIARLLPESPPPLPRPARPRPVDAALLPASFHKDLEAFLAWYRWRGEDPALARHLPGAGRAPMSVDSYRSAVSWLVRELVEGGEVAPDGITDLAAICRYSFIRSAAIRFSERRAAPDGGLKEHAGSLHSYVAKLSLIAADYVVVDAAERLQLKALRAQSAVRTRDVAQIAEHREKFLRELARNARMRRAVLLLPDTLMRAADERHARWAELRPKERMTCLRLAIAAAQTAILLRSMALRATNLRMLRHRGPDATLVMPRRAGEPPRIAIPAIEVKNKRRLDASLAPQAVPIVARFEQVYRRLLIESHPYGKPALDSDFLFPGSSADRPMDASTAALAFAEGVEHVGLAMTQHECRHAIACLILTEHPERLQVVADWLGDDPATVRRHYMFLDTQRAADLGQQHIAAMVAGARRAEARTRRDGAGR
jgi:hypothetical protein